MQRAPAVTADAAVDAAPPPPPPPPPPAVDRARAEAASRPEMPGAEAAWLPARALRAVALATGALPAPTRPEDRDGVTVWSLVADAATEPSRLAGVCETVTREEGRAACATDTVTWAGAERARVAVAWRSSGGRGPVGLAQPLRALARVGAGLCLVHAERTPRTLDVTVRARGPEELGRGLALLTVSPGLSDLILVRQEPRPDGLEAVLSWPLDRATGEADLGGDPWPERCEGRSTVGGEARAGTAPVPRERVRGGAAQGAVVRLGRREWLVTAGDRAAGAEVVAVRDAGLAVRMRGRGAPVVLRFPAGLQRPPPR